MKEAVEQMDLLTQGVLLDRLDNSNDLRQLEDRFERNLATQRQDATLPGEAAATEELAKAWDSYTSLCPQVFDPKIPSDRRRELYLAAVLPQSREVRAATQRLIDMNLASILAVPGKAQASSRRAHWAMRTLTLSALLIALLFAALIGRIILRPVRMLTRSVHAVEQGNLDQSVPVQSDDELGRLAGAFNTMADKLRSYRQLAQERLVRTEQTTQLAIDSLPDAVWVINAERKIELANRAARRVIRLGPGDDVSASPVHWLPALVDRISDTSRPTELSDYESMVQLDVDGETRYFLPRSAPIRDPTRRAIGATIVLADVTGLRRLDETKNSLLSLVSHELKTPLTSARMVLHLVADQKIGPLTPKQQDLLAAARDDADRLHQIVENLLDMSRIESGRALMDFQPIAPRELVERAMEPLTGMFQEVSLEVNIGPDLPLVSADTTRIGHVFANLLMNSLRHTPAGGHASISAAERGDWVEFTVRDTGSGIPRQYVHRVFEKFFRVPGQAGGSGSGLGLAIAKDVVEAHGGCIRVESIEGMGSTFAFTLRRSGEMAASPVESAHPLPVAAGS
jgi:signal transduction histidine kinase